jgi:F0F1-type ATP synthase assembly protein I
MELVRIMRYQIASVLLAVVMALAIYLDKPDIVKAVFFGGLVSVLTTAWMALRMYQAAKSMSSGDKKGAFYVYLGAIEKFLIAMALLGAGIVWLHMHPLPIIAGLVAGQIGFIVGSYKLT